MCHKATCNTCHGVTWWGCGNHIPAVLDNVPQDQWCKCEPKIETKGHQYPPKSSATS
ncbi:hypothetical protein CC78DRAFT_455093 [Lojkania enalia]|uniref:Uncharacterized protein n=1 Tax=Lojkania enalia TaxID=147567 RepID=A0A9P4KHX9_9PLEO|nr:hypothetical protein CC78DRAFT_455093 [Didymosphaeria enalia]